MSKHSHTHSHGLYPKHTHDHCPPQCPPMCPPPCPPPCPPSNWCLPGEKGPKGDQGPRGYPGKDGAGCTTKCCRFENAAELEKCKSTLTPDIISHEGQADRAALEKTIKEMPAGCDAGFILMTKCGNELAHFCYVCDGMSAKPLPQYRSGVFTYGAINPYALVYNTQGNAARFAPSGFLSPGDDKFLSRDMTYCVIPYKNGAEVKGFSWNWIGVKGMTVYFNLVALVCKPNGKQMLEVYGPEVQGHNNTAVKLTGNKNTYYAVNNNCGCQDLDLKLSCATTLGIVIRGIKKTPAAATTTNNLTNDSSSQCPPAISSTLVSNIVLENIDKIDSLQPSASSTVNLRSYDQPSGVFSNASDANTWKITSIFPVIEEDGNEYYTPIQLEKDDENDNDVYDGYISHTLSSLFEFTDSAKTDVGDAMKVNGTVYIFDNSSYPIAAVAPTDRQQKRFLRNLFMSVEYCQLNNASALPHQAASTGTPTVSPVIQPTKKVWTELRGIDIVTVKDTILKERADIAAHLNFVYVPTNSADEEASVAITPKAHDVIIYTNGHNDSGIALASDNLAPTLF